jgi:hypothetical protein
MKQNTKTRQSARRARNEKRGVGSGKSRYAEKVRRGDQMYGTGHSATGCCAHRVRVDYWGG